IHAPPSSTARPRAWPDSKCHGLVIALAPRLRPSGSLMAAMSPSKALPQCLRYRIGALMVLDLNLIASCNVSAQFSTLGRSRAWGRCMQGRGRKRTALLLVTAGLLGLWVQFARAQQEPPGLEAIFERGYQLYKAGKYAEAVPIAEEYLAFSAAKYGNEHP